MRIAITGGTGFLGHYIVSQLSEAGYVCRCLYRSDRRRASLVGQELEWVLGDLADRESLAQLVEGCQAVVHAAFDRPGRGFRGAEGDVVSFVRNNVLGTIELIEAARAANVDRFVFVSSCAVHERILGDRPLDEAHPLWSATHYGAYKAAVEQFVHSYGFGHEYNVCAIRPCGIYGLARPIQDSKWFDLVADIVSGRDVTCTGGGKIVHAADVARGIRTLLEAGNVQGEAYNCCERYLSDWDVAQLVKRMTGSPSIIRGQPRTAKHQILSSKLELLGFRFGGEQQLRETLEQLIGAA